MVRFSTWLAMKRRGIGMRRGGYRKTARFSKRYFGRRRAFKVGYRRGKRISRRRSGSGGKVGIYFPDLHAKVYVSRQKYRVMLQYARLIANSILQSRLTKHEDHEDMVISGDNNKEIKALEEGNTYHHIKKSAYRKIINHILVQMIKKNWYSQWYHDRNAHLAQEAQKTLQEAGVHHRSHLHNLLPPYHSEYDMHNVADVLKGL